MKPQNIRSVCMYSLKRCIFLILLLSEITFSYGQVQDTLPNFSLKSTGNNRVIVGWFNDYTSVKQISIQRSKDSLSGFKTILTVADPNNKENGYADNKVPYDSMYYRLFIVLEGSNFIFSPSKKPFLDTISVAATEEEIIELKKLKNYKEELLSDSGFTFKPDNITVKENVKTSVIYQPSKYVFSNKQGYLRINLPDFNTKNYHIKFFDDNDSFLFELKTVKDEFLLLDKGNFYHSGWFKFELYDGEELVEKNKFYISKEI